MKIINPDVLRIVIIALPPYNIGLMKFVQLMSREVVQDAAGCRVGEAAVHLGGSAEPSLKEPSASPAPLFPQSKGLKVPSLVGGDWIPGR